MNVITTSTAGRKRQMVHVQEINPRSFLFFFEKGSTGFSYSLRDFSVPNHVTERYASDFGWTADEIRQKATHIYDAPFLDVTKLADWHAYTVGLNRLHGLQESRVQPQAVATPSASAAHIEGFPMLNAAAFHALPKASKSGDVRRMSDSSRSEDWVTWNLLNLSFISCPDTWWARFAAVVTGANPTVQFSPTAGAPLVQFWKTVPSPKEYEAASRARMRRSWDPAVAARSRDPRPVEGNSEIDLALESSSLLAYIEAKLDSDISMRTTYDPDRNQIARNIDCLLDSARERTPYFWMLVRDDSPSRAYTQLMRKYKEDPSILARDLPHRDPALLRKVANGLAIMTWRDIARDLCVPGAADDEHMRSIKRELWRRIQ